MLYLSQHGFIWFINGNNQLPKKAKNLIKDINNKCYVSIATIWEIAIKISLGKLELNGGFNNIITIDSPFFYTFINTLVLMSSHHFFGQQ